MKIDTGDPRIIGKCPEVIVFVVRVVPNCLLNDIFCIRLKYGETLRSCEFLQTGG